MKAKAIPTKSFFVRMLTRDISLDDCVLDLVDNSIDGAWKSSSKHPSSFLINEDLAQYQVCLSIEPNQFTITDNCGGITLDDAVDYAFTFGRSRAQAESDYSVGVYGIGMKRAAFKIGDSIIVDSTYADNGQLQGFRVPITVPEWLTEESDNWDFDLVPRTPNSEAGVTITIGELSEETRNRFSDPTYQAGLRRVLARDYMVPLMRGLSLQLNDTPVVGERIRLGSSERFVSMRDAYPDGDVTVELVAGMAYSPPDSNEPESAPSRADEVSGWYIICNGRTVLAADRSAITGWGVNDLPGWHPQYKGFVGVAFFSSKRSVLLPMTTTKRSVDVSSAVYRRALARMATPTRAWVDYTNKRKGDDSFKDLEAEVSAVEIPALPLSPQVALPEVTSGPAREQVANVNFSVPLPRMRELASAFGVSTVNYRLVGQKAFDYAHERLVNEDAE